MLFGQSGRRATEYDFTERARDEPDCEGGVGKQDRNQRVLRREEKLLKTIPATVP